MNNIIPNEIDECIQNYFKSLKNIKSLSKEEEHKLLRRYKKKNDLRARDILIVSNLKYACKMAAYYKGRGIPFYDLIAEANLGLIESIDKFDLKQDVKLISYAKWKIRQNIEVMIKNKLKMKESDLPTDNEAPLNEYDNDVYVQTNINSNDENFIYEENENETKDINDFFEKVFINLSEREIDMINMKNGRFYDKEYTLEEIGEKYHLTKERVRQIIEIALRKVRSEAILLGSKYLSR